jgi:hypothetical protein
MEVEDAMNAMKNVFSPWLYNLKEEKLSTLQLSIPASLDVFVKMV